MNKRAWKSGPPPHAGWWSARLCTDTRLGEWRWWDGKCWSTPAYRQMTCGQAGQIARCVTSRPLNSIQWCDYWPENARVPRITPVVAAFAPEMTIGEVDANEHDEPCGDWIDLDLPNHGGVAKAVWRMEGAKRSPKMEETARRMVASWNHCRAMSLEALEAS